ncbi:MAG: hypothetical protein QXP80_00685 [Zestosphaera sp.]
MGNGIPLILSRVVSRGSGFKVSVVTTINVSLTLIFRSNALVPYVALALSTIASIASVIVDFGFHSTVTYVLLIHGSRPNHIKTYIALHSLLTAGVLSLPYVMLGFRLFLTALALTSVVSLLALSLTYRVVKKSASVPQI